MSCSTRQWLRLLPGYQYTNVAAEPTGRTLATRLWHMTDDPGRKDFLSFLIAHDTIPPNQWMAVIEENGGLRARPVPNSFPQSEEVQGFHYAFVSTYIGSDTTEGGRWTQEGPSLDGKGEFHVEKAAPLGSIPVLAPPVPGSFAQKEQMATGKSIIGAVTGKMEGPLSGSKPITEI